MISSLGAVPATAILDFRMAVIARPDDELGMLAGDDPMLVELVAELADHGLDLDEVDDDALVRQQALDLGIDVVVVAVEPLLRAVGEDQEMGAGELEVLLVQMDRPAFARHRPGISGAPRRRPSSRRGPEYDMPGCPGPGASALASTKRAASLPGLARRDLDGRGPTSTAAAPEP